MDDKDTDKSMSLQEEGNFQTPRTRPSQRRGLMPPRRNPALNASVFVAGDGSAHSPVLPTLRAPSGQAEGLFNNNTKMQTNGKTSAAESRNQPHTYRRYLPPMHCEDLIFQKVIPMTVPAAVAGGGYVHGLVQHTLRTPCDTPEQPLDLSRARPSGSQDPERTVDMRSTEHKGSNKRKSDMDTSVPQHGLSSSRDQQARHSSRELEMEYNFRMQQGRRTHREEPGRHSPQEQQGRHSPQEQPRRHSLQEQPRRHSLQEQQGRPREHHPLNLAELAASLGIMPNQANSSVANQDKIMFHPNGYENHSLFEIIGRFFNFGDRQGISAELYRHWVSLQDRHNSMMNQTSANAPIGAQSNEIDMPNYKSGGQLNRLGSTSTTSISPDSSSPPQATTESSSHLPIGEYCNQNFSSIWPSGIGPRHGLSIQNTNSMTNQASANSAIGAQLNGMGVQQNPWKSSPSPSISPNTSSLPLATTESSNLPNEEENSNQNSSSISPSENELQAPCKGTTGCRKRARSTMPDEQKDAAYWAKRKKNNEAAKRSRDLRRAKEDQNARRSALLQEEAIRYRIEIQSLQNEIAKFKCMVYNYKM